MRHAATQHRGTLLAVTEEAPGVFDLELAEGRFLSTLDRERRSSVVVLGAEAADVLFPTSAAVGQHVRVYLKPPRSFTVIGVVASRPDAVGLSFDSSVYVPFETYGNRIEPIARVGRYAIGVRNEADVLAVSRDVEDFFFERTGNRNAVRIVSPSTVAEMFDAVTSTLSAFLTGIAAISLIVGGVGIMNIMLVSVTERTKEIGIRKALGASPRVIRGQFLIEAVTLTLVGGLLGVVIGTLISYWGTWLLGWSFSPNPWAYPLALLFSSSVGIFFGLYPAIRASRLDPVQALAYE